jgi:ribonucleoside-diphosphate reductase alpha chain
MRMAMALAEDETGDTKLIDVKAYYDEFSFNRINPPSPNYINLGTKLNGYSSCCLYTVADDSKSLAIGDHIAYTMTCMSAGIGGYLGIRSIGDSVRNGLLEHGGRLPYYNALAGAVKANIQAGRGGACTTYFTCFDPEVTTLIMLQNPRTPVAKQNRDMHFAIQYNRLFAKKVAREEKVFLFNSFTAPDLHKLFFTSDQDGFEALYNKYEADKNFKKTYLGAREILHMARQQAYEISTLYEANMDEINRHTSFIEPIYSANLCVETVQPTAPYFKMQDLYSKEDNGSITFTVEGDETITLPFSDKANTQNGVTFAGNIKVGDVIEGCLKVKEIIEITPTSEVSLCSLAAQVVCNIHTDEAYERSSYYALKMIDKCIHLSDYPLPHIEYTAKSRLNAGLGVLGVATYMARKGLKYSSQEGRNEIHRLAERHSYFAIKASLKLGQEKGNAPWIHKTKWPQGWLPIDTYKKAVDKLAAPIYQYDWEQLRKDIVANGGIHNSSVVNHMPTESSSKASGVNNGWYPSRSLSMKKSDESNVLDWVAVDNDILADQYENAYEIPTLRMIDVYAIIQKFTDESISADLYRDRSTPDKVEIPTSEITEEYLYMVKHGIKTRYYQNSLTTEGQAKEATVKEELCASGGCDV